MLGYSEILELGNQGVITPFLREQVRDGVLSYGMSGSGYDFRLGTKIRFPRRDTQTSTPSILDPKNIDKDVSWMELDVTDRKPFYIPPCSFVLGTLIEYIDLPNNILMLFIGKSTYARVGLIANVTPAEPGWKGHLTVELTNPLRDFWIAVYPNEGILQGMFFRAESDTLLPYRGKYQNQPQAPILAKMFKDGLT